MSGASSAPGSFFLVGFDGTRMTPDLRRFLEADRVAGVVLFERNLEGPAQTAALVNEIQGASPEPPVLVAIDQEGGRVARLKAPFTLWPSARKVGEHFARTKSIRDVYAMGEAIAAELEAVGINMDLAPVLDVATNAANPVIGDRAFSEKAHVVCDLALAFMAGLQDSRVVACGKHFPGHGDTSEDSHVALPVVPHQMGRLREVELAPFAHLIENGLKSVMTAHVVFPALDRENPATLSERILEELLRKELGFRGVVVSDDLLMKAVGERWPPGPASVRALRAGVDLLLIGRGTEEVRRAIDAVGEALAKGEIPPERGERALGAIRDLRTRFLRPWKALDAKGASRRVGTADHKKLARELGGGAAA